MSVWNFVKDAGERIVENAKAAVRFGAPQKQAEAPAAAQKPANGNSAKAAGDAIASYIRTQGLEVDDLNVAFDAPSATVHVSGTAKDQATKEKVILSCGNIAGVEKVTDDLAVRESAPEAQYHTVVKGDTLSAIAKKYYGDARKYPLIFEANKPMLKDPDKIYPGQSLRIPPQA